MPVTATFQRQSLDGIPAFLQTLPLPVGALLLISVVRQQASRTSSQRWSARQQLACRDMFCSLIQMLAEDTQRIIAPSRDECSRAVQNKTQGRVLKPFGCKVPAEQHHALACSKPALRLRVSPSPFCVGTVAVASAFGRSTLAPSMSCCLAFRPRSSVCSHHHLI